FQRRAPRVRAPARFRSRLRWRRAGFAGECCADVGSRAVRGVPAIAGGRRRRSGLRARRVRRDEPGGVLRGRDRDVLREAGPSRAVCAAQAVLRAGSRPAGAAGRAMTHARGRLIDVSHTIEHGMVTYPGLPAPAIGDWLSRAASQARYGPGTTFQIGKIELVANTGTYIDAPSHRYEHGKDVADFSLDAVADLEGVIVRVTERDGRALDVETFRVPG